MPPLATLLDHVPASFRSMRLHDGDDLTELQRRLEAWSLIAEHLSGEGASTSKD